MPFTPENSALKLTSAEEAKTREMGHEELKEYLNNLKVEQGLVVRDRFSPDVLLPVDAPPRRQEQERLTKIFTINGKRYAVEGADESELVAAELEVHRAVLSGAPPPEATTVVARDAQGKFVSRSEESQEDSAMRAAREAEARLRMMRGEISVEKYIEETHALDNYLKENFGLDKQSLADQREVEDWTSATKQFLEQTEIGRSWPGGEANLQKAQEILSENPQLLENGASKVDALVAIAEHMKANNLFQGEAEELTRARQQNADATEMSRASSVEEIRLAAARSLGIPQDRNRNW
jgi:hypothetical protein